MAELPPSEVKGVWFVAALDYAREIHGDAVVAQLLELAPRQYRDVYANPIPSAWYPEEAFQEALSMLYEVVAQENDFLFERIMEGCTEKGVSRLFQMLLRMSSPAFVLRRVPTMWRHIRRGAGRVEVEQGDGYSIVRYGDFPWFSDKLYRLLTTGSLRAIVRYCANEKARVDVLEHGTSELSVRIAYRAVETLPPVQSGSARPPPSTSVVVRTRAIHEPSPANDVERRKRTPSGAR